MVKAIRMHFFQRLMKNDAQRLDKVAGNKQSGPDSGIFQTRHPLLRANKTFRSLFSFMKTMRQTYYSYKSTSKCKFLQNRSG